MSTATPRPPQAVPQASLDALLKIHNQDIAEAEARGVLRGITFLLLGEIVLLVLGTWLWSVGL